MIIIIKKSVPAGFKMDSNNGRCVCVCVCACARSGTEVLCVFYMCLSRFSFPLPLSVQSANSLSPSVFSVNILQSFFEMKCKVLFLKSLHHV